MAKPAICHGKNPREFEGSKGRNQAAAMVGCRIARIAITVALRRSS